MKRLTILAAALLIASAASAQDKITTRFVHATEGPEAPKTDRGKNDSPTNPGLTDFKKSYADYNQDACIVQAGTTNFSSINQTDGRRGTTATNSGSSAYISQTSGSSLNNAYQTQTLDNSSDVAGGRNLLRSTQSGTMSQSDQTQTNGYKNTAAVYQGVGTVGNQATQTQTGGSGNSAQINQTNALGYGISSGNRAEQLQTGSDESAQITQQGKTSYAMQTQSGYSDHAEIYQGAPGMNNTAIQTQSGSENVARINQSKELPIDNNNNNYAEQNQSGFGDQASIDQHGAKNFAQQDQAGSGSIDHLNDPNNESSIIQSNVPSAAYTGQTGTLNTANIFQH